MKFSILITRPGHENDGKWWHQNGDEPVDVQHAGWWKDDDFTIANARDYEKEGKVKIVPYRDRFRVDLDFNHGRHKAASTLREYTSAERKAMPIDAGCLQYFPDALAAVARVSVKGNEKHNPGQPLHWSRDKSSDHAECITRHHLTPDAIDQESGEQHRAHRAWRDLADLQIAEEKRLIALGIKPLSGVVK